MDAFITGTLHLSKGGPSSTPTCPPLWQESVDLLGPANPAATSQCPDLQAPYSQQGGLGCMTSQTDQLVLEPSHWDRTLGTPPTWGCCSREAGDWGAQQQNLKQPAPEHINGPVPSGELSQAERDQSSFQDR